MEGYWNDKDDRITVKIAKESDESYSGTIVWLKEPLNAKGEPEIDRKNPDKKLRGRAILGMKLMYGFKLKKENLYHGGFIYNPQNGKTYKAQVHLHIDKMKLRGYIGIPALGMTTTWHKTQTQKSLTT